ncbi:MAG: T9SS type A sorting domain-containing protein, partial [Fibrobacteraceae bacterium]|nr:T9SS type A sorting domain-containing protein [Fibrobacteraceae bacterium]
TWSGNFLEKTPTEMWKRNLDDERIIALDNMPGWDKYTPSTIPIAGAIPRNTNKLNILIQENSIQLNIPASGFGQIQLYDIQGNLIQQIAKGFINKGELPIGTSKLSRGMYILQAKVGSSSLIKSIQIP